MRLIAFIVLALFIGAGVTADTPWKVGKVPPAKLELKTVKSPHVSVDIVNRLVVLDAKVCLRRGALEFLVCGEGTKEHESILSTEGRASDLHAAMLAIGLRQGIAVSESSTGEVIPPGGPEVRINLEWMDTDGNTISVRADEWLHAAPGCEVEMPDNWVFVGSQFADDGRYLADLNGEIVSVANFRTSVFDVPLTSSESNALLQFTANTDKIPQIDTSVRVIFEPTAEAAQSPYARAYLEIGLRGEMKSNGEPVAPGKLRAWAREFTNAHPKGQVVFRVDGRVMVWQVEIAKHQLRTGGVRDFDQQVIPPDGPLLPMTEAQAAESLAIWTKGLAASDGESMTNARSYLPLLMKHIDRQLAELEELSSLLERYRDRLTEIAARQPASQPVNPKEVKPQ